MIVTVRNYPQTGLVISVKLFPLIANGCSSYAQDRNIYNSRQPRTLVDFLFSSSHREEISSI